MIKALHYYNSDKSYIAINPVFISHAELMKAVKTSVYSATAIGFSWVSSTGCAF